MKLRASFCSLVAGISGEFISGANTISLGFLKNSGGLKFFSLGLSLRNSWSSRLPCLLVQQNQLDWVLHCFSLCIRYMAFQLILDLCFLSDTHMHMHCFHSDRKAIT